MGAGWQGRGDPGRERKQLGDMGPEGPDGLSSSQAPRGRTRSALKGCPLSKRLQLCAPAPGRLGRQPVEMPVGRGKDLGAL